jgi:hypothetical protein
MGLRKKSTLNHTHTAAEEQNFLAAKSIWAFSHPPNSPGLTAADILLSLQGNILPCSGFAAPGHLHM